MKSCEVTWIFCFACEIIFEGSCLLPSLYWLFVIGESGDSFTRFCVIRVIAHLVQSFCYCLSSALSAGYFLVSDLDLWLNLWIFTFQVQSVLFWNLGILSVISL